MAAEFELTDEMRAVVGVESEPWPVEITTTSIRAFARGVGYTDRALLRGGRRRPAGAAVLPRHPGVDPGESDATFSGPRNTGPGVRHGLKGLLDGGTEVVYRIIGVGRDHAQQGERRRIVRRGRQDVVADAGGLAEAPGLCRRLGAGEGLIRRLGSGSGW